MDIITELVFKSARGDRPTVRCPNCGHVVEPSAKFCLECGSTIVPQTTPETSAVMRHCSSCGAETSATAKFCKECGKAL